MNEHERRVPDFFLVGVPRCATTSLYYALGQHPRVFTARLKEACFTCPDIDPRRRRTQTKWIYDPAEYHGLFAGAAPDRIVGEGCIYNIYSPEAPHRIKELNGDARIVVNLRDPIEQMRSAHALKVIMNDMPWVDFTEAVSEQARLRAGRIRPPVDFGAYDLRDKATVSHGLRRFVDAFGRDRVHANLYEDFAADQLAVYRSTLRFLGVDAAFLPRFDVMVPNRRARWDGLNRAMGSSGVISTAKRVVPRGLHPAGRALASAVFRANRTRVTREPLDPALRDRLREEFRPEVERLGEIVGQDLVARWWSAAQPARVLTPVEQDPAGADAR